MMDHLNLIWNILIIPGLVVKQKFSDLFDYRDQRFIRRFSYGYCIFYASSYWNCLRLTKNISKDFKIKNLC